MLIYFLTTITLIAMYVLTLSRALCRALNSVFSEVFRYKTCLIILTHEHARQCMMSRDRNIPWVAVNIVICVDSIYPRDLLILSLQFEKKICLIPMYRSTFYFFVVLWGSLTFIRAVLGFLRHPLTFFYQKKREGELHIILL